MHDINIYKPPIWEGMTMAPRATVLAMNQSWKELEQAQMKQEEAESLDSIGVVNEGDMHQSRVEADLQGYINGRVEQQVKISISHDGDYATAVCLAVREKPSRPKQPRKLTGSSEREDRIKEMPATTSDT